MSRHQIPDLPEKYNMIIVGWDPPMSTFFAQVYVIGEWDMDTDEPTKFIGYMPREAFFIARLMRWLEVECDITMSDDLLAMLAADKVHDQ